MSSLLGRPSSIRGTPRRRRHTDSPSGSPTLPLFRPTMLSTKLDLSPTALRWTNLLIWTLMSSVPNTSSNSPLTPSLLSALVSRLLLWAFPTRLTGHPREPSLLSRTRVNAVLVGPSPPLDQLRVLISFPKTHSSPSLSNSWLIAHTPMETMDAMVAWWTFPFSISRIMELPLKTSTHTRELDPPANTLLLIRSGLSVTALRSLLIRRQAYSVQLPRLPSLSPSKQTIFPSSFTRAEFTLETAELTLTTECLLLDMEQPMERSTTRLKTHGEAPGETKVLFTLRELEMEKESAESKWLLPIP